MTTEKKRRENHAEEPFTAPFTILVDGRENLPYLFTNLRADARLNHRPLIVPWDWAQLQTGDYTLQGCEDLITIERKSLEDLYSTISQRRRQFEREHQRMCAFEFAAVVVEASWERILNDPPVHSQIPPAVVFATHHSWLQCYGIPWIPAEDRRLAEIITYRLLEKFWYELQAILSQPAECCRVCGGVLKGRRSQRIGLGPVCERKGDPKIAERIRRGER